MKSEIVIDTDIISYIFKGDSRGTEYHGIILSAIPVISFMTIAELEIWMRRRNWENGRKEELRNFLSDIILYDSNLGLCRRWAEIVEMRFRAGRPIQQSDAWIAATALELNCPLATNNLRDYELIPGLKLVSIQE